MLGHGQGKLAMCGCGKCHFTYGSVTLHFDREEFLLFADSVGRLGAMIRQVGQEPAASWHPPSANTCH